MKTKLVLHICCAPDEAWVVKSLQEEYELFCFFCNPNIQPEDEYNKRLKEAEKVASIYKVPIANDPYKPELWRRATHGFEHTPEGGERCSRCFLLRLKRTARFSQELGWSLFTTVMSISPHKKIEMLNSAGKQAAEEYGVTYREFDFKKKDGFLNSIKLSEELGLYRQDYCGCILSKKERDARNLQKNIPEE
jgi:predicted adenine nucleotide alpha hydrolase (AANH) superfamily ATPase